MNIQELDQCVREARNTVSEASRSVRCIAYILEGKLQEATVSHSTLCALKRELANYNMHTGLWGKQ